MSDALRNRMMFGARNGYNLAREGNVVGSEQRNK